MVSLGLDELLQKFVDISRFVRKRWLQVIEASMVASLSGLVAYILIFYIEDCQAIGKDPNEHYLQVSAKFST